MEVPSLQAGLDGRDANPRPGRVRAPLVPGMPRLRPDPAPGPFMTAGGDDASPADHESAAGFEYTYGKDALLGVWPALYAASGVPLWMVAELDRLRAAFPEFSFGICRGWRGLMFEAWRDLSAGGLYAMITRDAMELWHELVQYQGGLRPVTDACGNEAR